MTDRKKPEQPTPNAAQGDRASDEAVASPEETTAGAADPATDERPVDHLPVPRAGPAKSAGHLGDLARAWAGALRALMRIAGSGTTGVLVCGGHFDPGETLADIAALARERDRDVIFLDFGGAPTTEPPVVIVATRGRRSNILAGDCELWALRGTTQVELLTPTHRIRIDDAGEMVVRPNRLDEMRARRVTAAHKRWRTFAHKLAKELRTAAPAAVAANAP